MTKQTVALAVGSPEAAKNAALYFDSVVDLWIGPEVAPKDFWPEGLKNDKTAAGGLAEIAHSLAMAGRGDTIANTFVVGRSDYCAGILLPRPDGSTNANLEKNYLANEAGVVDVLKDFFGRRGVGSPVLIMRSDCASEVPSSTPDPMVIISGMKLVDVSSVSWQQIVEFRKDEESAKDFRRLSLFEADNLRGKDRHYIEQRIAQEMDDYDQICKKHGFDLIPGILKSVTSTPNVIAASTALLAAMLGAPLSVVLSAPIALELAGLTFEVVKNRADLREAKRLHPLAYVMRAPKDLR